MVTIQELCDHLTVLCHEGHAQAEVKMFTDGKMKDVSGISLCGTDFDTAIIESEE